jgi:tetratricopeptide (TPR) repeat protein
MSHVTNDSSTAPPPNAQSASVGGNYNIVLQANGDGITIDVNRPHLTLNARHRFAREPREYLDLLNPINRAIPMVGREAEMRGLEDWLGSGVPISARCLIGGAGSGKTRLALELCTRADHDDWFAGFVDHGELVRFHDQQDLASWGWPKATLIVVDYAAAKTQVLREWLAELVKRPGDAKEPPLRLLLLERHADPALGWWPELTTPRGWPEEGLRELFDPIEPIPLPNIRDIEERRQILDTVMAAASKIAGKSEPLRPPPKGSDPDFDHRLAEPALEFAPLHLMMAGVLGVEHSAPRLLTLGPTAMAQELANFELGRIETLAKDRYLDFHVLRYLAAGITLAGGLSRNDLAEVIASESQVMGFSDATPTVERALLDALPAERADQVGGILPDLIGEAAVVKVIGELAPRQQAGAIKRWHERSPTAVMSALIRTIQDYATKDDHPSLKWFDGIVAGASAVSDLMSIANQLPQQTVVLRDRAAGVEAAIVQSLRALRGGSESHELTADFAGSLNNLANRLSELGRREEALATTREAVDIRRELAAARPDAFRPYLAASLNNLATMLSQLGRREEALEVAREAVESYRELAAARPDAFRPDLAASLNNLAAMLSDLGRREAALATAQEAVDIRRELAAARPDAFRPDLARSLNNLANMLSGLGRREAALTTAQEAVELNRELAAARPDAFRPDLAASLSNLANRLSDLGRREAALAVALEAAALYRELAAARPDAFRPDLAGSLNNLANRLSDLGRSEDALATAQEAVELYRGLATARPDAFRPDLAMSLTNLTTRLSDLGRREEGLAAAQEAVELYRELAAARPDAFRPDLAGSLNNLANRLRESGRREEALAAGQEAVDIRRGLAAARPDAFRPDLATSLNNLANRLSQLGRREQALATAQEAVDIRRELAAARPDAFRPYLATSLSVMAGCLEALERLEEANHADAEAVAALSPYFIAERHAFAGRMAPTVREYLRRCEKLGREPDKELLGPIAAAFEKLQEGD